jgi:hypothetical protein
VANPFQDRNPLKPQKRVFVIIGADIRLLLKELGVPLFEAFRITTVFVTKTKKTPQKNITPNPHPRRQKVSREDIITRFCNVASYAK